MKRTALRRTTRLKQGQGTRKRRKPIKRVSEKRKPLIEKRREFNQTLPELCAIKSPVCWGKAQSWHEAIKRSAGGEIVPSLKALKQGQQFFAACHVCNDWIEQHPAWAEERGFVISGHKKVREQQGC